MPTPNSPAMQDLITGMPVMVEACGSNLNLVLTTATDSTNRLARDLIDRMTMEAVPATAVLALTQTAGEGRGERRWHSRVGAGVWATWLGAVQQSSLATLPTRVGVALCSAVEELGVRGVRLKWPNDLVHGDDRRKLAGVLCRSMLRGDNTHVLCGFGVNLDNPGGVLAERSVGLRQLGCDADFWSIAAAVVGVVHESMRWDRDAWRRGLERCSVHSPDELLTWHDHEVVKTGRFLGFDADGRLRLEVDGVEHVLASGEID